MKKEDQKILEELITDTMKEGNVLILIRKSRTNPITGDVHMVPQIINADDRRVIAEIAEDMRVTEIEDIIYKAKSKAKDNKIKKEWALTNPIFWERMQAITSQ